MLDASTQFEMVFGSAKFEPFLGELQLATMMKEVLKMSAGEAAGSEGLGATLTSLGWGEDNSGAYPLSFSPSLPGSRLAVSMN